MTSGGAAPPIDVAQVPIDELRPDPANPRRIDETELDALERSLRQFGLVQPVLARREDRTVIGGHQRLVAARRLGLTTVPVTWLDISVDQARLLGLALNKISGTWDEQLLARLLAELQSDPGNDLSLSGFDEGEVRDLLRSLEAREKRERPEAFDLDEALAEARKAPRTKPGELWALGDHRLLCGDATSPDDVARVLGGASPTLLTTDPPYGVALDPTWRDGVYNALGPAEVPYLRKKGHRNTIVSGDTRVDWADAFALVPSLTVGYVWHAGVHAAAVAEGLVRVGFEIVAQVIWDKGLFAIGRSWYHWGARALLGGSEGWREGEVPRPAGPGDDLASALAEDDHGRQLRAKGGPSDPEAPRPLRDPDPEPSPAGWPGVRPVPRVGDSDHRRPRSRTWSRVLRIVSLPRDRQTQSHHRSSV